MAKDDQTPKRGRPPAEDAKTPVTAWVHVSEYDRLVKMANQQDKSVSSLVRSLLVLKLR